MIGIKDIGTYIPEGRISNLSRMEKFDVDESFILDKIGIESVSVKRPEQETSDLAIFAVEDLVAKSNLDLQSIDALILITQNPDKKIPHTSAVVHGKMDFSEHCACFDISLGCSGFVYGLSVIKSFMETNNFSKGILITCDPYSKILNPNDKNTSLLFGDGATATLMTDDPVFIPEKFTFGTIGKERENLVCNEDLLEMNGRGIFNFAARYLPKDISKILEVNNLSLQQIDKFIFHQGSKYIIDTLIKRIKIPEEKVAYDIMKYGNTVSSSVPLILAKELNNKSLNNILISGFGVGLSWSSNVLTRIK